ncbi:MAG: prolyl oligopeptidase family serine peptidase [Bacteroidota bacterium]
MIRTTILLFLLSGCSTGSAVNENKSDVADTMKVAEHVDANRNSAPILRDTTLMLPWLDTKVKVSIRAAIPGVVKGTILILPGWNHSPLYWCDKMDFCKKAVNAGFNLVMPEIQKGVYTDNPFPETRADLVKMPTMKFVDSVMLPVLQKEFGVLMPGGNNFITGLSTGARGAVLIAMNHPDIFRKGVALSGDFDNSLLATDKVMIAYYGPKSNFEKRWNEEANPAKSVEKLTMPFIFVHAKDDNVVRYDNTTKFVELIGRTGINKDISFISSDTGAHTYPFWNRYVDTTLTFFSDSGNK